MLPEPQFPHVSIEENDCLLALEALQARSATFDLIYVDPPYNAGGARAARVHQGERAHGELAYTDRWGGLDAFLDMLAPRLAAMRNVLSTQGTLWVHLDHRTVHSVKVLLDRIFGATYFQGEVIWVPGNGGRRKGGPRVTHQTLLIYSKTNDFIWNTTDPVLREPYAQTSRQMHFKQTDENGRAYRERTVSGRTYRYYADAGRPLGSVWSDCPSMLANTPLLGETTGYPTQKPEALLRRIVLLSSNPQSAVLDPMCGSGTTLAAAAGLGRRAHGIDQSPVAVRIVRERIAKFISQPSAAPSIALKQ